MVDSRRESTRERRSASVYLLMLLVLFLSVNALIGGSILIVDPSGGGMDMPVSLLESSPFANYFIPGVILFIVLGILPLLALLALGFKPPLLLLRSLERLTHMHWSWAAAGAVGSALTIWILVQMTILSFWLQPILLALGFAIIGVSFLPSVRRYYAQPERP